MEKNDNLTDRVSKLVKSLSAKKRVFGELTGAVHPGDEPEVIATGYGGYPENSDYAEYTIWRNELYEYEQTLKYGVDVDDIEKQEAALEELLGMDGDEVFPIILMGGANFSYKTNILDHWNIDDKYLLNLALKGNCEEISRACFELMSASDFSKCDDVKAPNKILSLVNDSNSKYLVEGCLTLLGQMSNFSKIDSIEEYIKLAYMADESKPKYLVEGSLFLLGKMLRFSENSNISVELKEKIFNRATRFLDSEAPSSKTSEFIYDILRQADSNIFEKYIHELEKDLYATKKDETGSELPDNHCQLYTLNKIARLEKITQRAELKTAILKRFEHQKFPFDTVENKKIRKKAGLLLGYSEDRINLNLISPVYTLAITAAFSYLLADAILPKVIDILIPYLK